MTFISILIPFKKGRRFLKDCLESVHEQGLDDFEIILIVNGADEDIDDLVNFPDNIVIKEFDEEFGVSKARNEALKVAQGDYVYFIDSDDYLYDDALSKLVEMAKRTNADFINGQRIETYYIKARFNEELEVNKPKILSKNGLSDEEFSMKLLVGEPNPNLEVLSVLHSLIKRDKIGDLKFNEQKRYYADYEFMANLVDNLSTFAGVENAVYAKRISDDIINLPSLTQESHEFDDYIGEYMIAHERLESDALKDAMAGKLFDYYSSVFSLNYLKNPNQKSLDSFCEISKDFKAKSYNLIRKIELKSLKSKNRKRLLQLMKLKVNYDRLINLVKDPERFNQIIYHHFYNKQEINKKRIVFESFSGHYYTDNPKYLYEYIYNNYKDDFEYVWVIDDNKREILGNPLRVKKYSLKYHKMMATSKYWVINTRQPARLVKRPGQVLLSTWHGTPLKKLGFDMGNIYLNNPRTKDTYIRDSSMWDYFVSPNRFSTPILKRAFAYEGEMLETGYPRNDILYNADESMVNQIKENLNLPSDKKVILYAPTWRDDDAYDVAKVKFKLRLELDKLEKAVGDEYIVLVRTHYLITDSDVGDYGDFAVDVSKYDDIAELYLVSDILITDYSSVFFDYANLRRPILFYTYDLDKYENELRGFYIDIHSEVPGPLLRTTEEVIDALNNIDEIASQYSEKYDEFYERFCSIEDGNASKRIFEKVWDIK